MNVINILPRVNLARRLDCLNGDLFKIFNKEKRLVFIVDSAFITLVQVNLSSFVRRVFCLRIANADLGFL